MRARFPYKEYSKTWSSGTTQSFLKRKKIGEKNASAYVCLQGCAADATYGTVSLRLLPVGGSRPRDPRWRRNLGGVQEVAPLRKLRGPKTFLFLARNLKAMQGTQRDVI